MSEQVENCGNCAFGQERGQFSWKCRRHAPAAQQSEFGMKAYWPSVQMTDFCGDFELKDAK